jgi:hypothetical protein
MGLSAWAPVSTSVAGAVFCGVYILSGQLNSTLRHPHQKPYKGDKIKGLHTSDEKYKVTHAIEIAFPKGLEIRTWFKQGIGDVIPRQRRIFIP